MKITKFCKGIIGSAGALACAALVPIEYLCDTIGADVDCPHYEYDARHDAVKQRYDDMDYYSAHGAEKCLDFAIQNFKDAFRN